MGSYLPLEGLPSCMELKTPGVTGNGGGAG